MKCTFIGENQTENLDIYFVLTKRNFFNVNFFYVKLTKFWAVFSQLFQEL